MTDDRCTHSNIITSVGRYAIEAGFKRPSPLGRQSSMVASDASRESRSFPGPLVLPGDDIALDPEYPAQSVGSWVRDKDRNQVTTLQRKIYVAGPPVSDRSATAVQEWAQPSVEKYMADTPLTESPRVEDVMRYVAAFYHDLSVQLFGPKSCASLSGHASRPQKIPKMPNHQH